MDQSPAVLLRMGVGHGKWQFIATDQLDAFMRPDNTHKVRVYAACLKLAMGNNRRLAVRYDPKQKKQVPATPADILAMLNAADPRGLERLQRQHVYRALCGLEADGLVRQSGRPVKGARLLFIYIRPRPARPGEQAGDPESEAADPGPEPEIVITSGYNGSANLTNDNYLRNAIILPLRSQIVKKISEAIRKALPQDPAAAEIVTTDGYKNEVAALVDQALNVIAEGYKKLSIVTSYDAFVASGDDTHIRNVFTVFNGSLSSSSPEPAVQPEAEATTTTAPPPEEDKPADPVAEAFRYYAPSADPDAIESLKRQSASVRAGVTDQDIIDAIHEKGLIARKKDNPTGFLLKAVPNVLRAAPAKKKTIVPVTAWEESPPDPDDDPVVAERQCKKCGGRIETYQSGKVSTCACAANKAKVAAP